MPTQGFATGVSTKPDTVTTEATAIQGYHNEAMLIILDEAAGVLPEIWRAVEHIGAPFKRVVVIGNPTSGTGDFASALRDPTWNHIKISVTDTPNFKTGRQLIPGVYGREYEQRIRDKYGIDSDAYRVRVLGDISAKKAEGAYYGHKMAKLRRDGRITKLRHNPNYGVYIVRDPGYTSAFWFFQEIGTDIFFLRYYEDSGPGVEDYVRVFDGFKREEGYHYLDNFVPCDMSSNAHRIVTGYTAMETLRNLGEKATGLPVERKVSEGIARTNKFLDRCWFDEDKCKVGIDMIEGYHERKNKILSTEDSPVFTGVPDPDGCQHGADALRYASMAVVLGYTGKSEVSVAQLRRMARRHRRPA
jgi:hypothetical protein